MDFALAPDLEALAAEARGVAAMWSAPVPEDSWLVGHSREFSLELARRGWLGMTWPVEEGGGGRPALERLVVFEALIAGGAPVAYSWFADRQIGPTLLRFGTPAQRARFLPGIIAGTDQWCVGMSEPDAGSDVASLRTRAERADGGWLVNGTKVWMSGATTGDWCYLIARTDPEAAPHAGLSELVVALDSPGIEVRPIRDMTDGRHFCEVTFTDVFVPDDLLVGEVNGSFRQVMAQMEHERGGIDRLVSNRALEQVPAERLLVLRTPDIRVRAARLAAFAGVAPDTLDLERSHEFQGPVKHHVLDELDPSYLDAKLHEHCDSLILPLYEAAASS